MFQDTQEKRDPGLAVNKCIDKRSVKMDFCDRIILRHGSGCFHHDSCDRCCFGTIFVEFDVRFVQDLVDAQTAGR